MKTKSLIIIPTYNEKENVERMIDTVISLAKEFHVLFVDDNSPDGTADLIEKAIKKHPGRVFIEKRAGKLGLGTAYIHGFKWSMEKDYDFVFEMDCDFSHNPEDLLRLHKELEQGCDLVIGSRYCKGGKVKNWPLKRTVFPIFSALKCRNHS